MSNQPRMLRVEFHNIARFKDNKLEIDFTNQQKVFDVDNNNIMQPLFSSVYVPKIFSVVGINASGKSTFLELIQTMFHVFFCNVGLNGKIESKALNAIYKRNHPLEIKTFYSVSGKLYLLHSIIKRDEESETNSGRKFIFQEENLYFREISNTLSKKDLYNETMYYPSLKRNELSKEKNSFLEKSKSIAFATIPQDDESIIRSDVVVHGYIDSLMNSNLKTSIIQYLDNSIEYIRMKTYFDGDTNNEKTSLYDFKRYGHEKKEVTGAHLLSVLSTGTLKGLEMFSNIRDVLKCGGYFVVDELENHFNKSIIMDILKLFKDKATNPKAATLIFSTHYPELLESIERNDCIFITYREKETYDMNMLKLSDLLKRNDLSKSDLFFSDYWNIGTAINYDNYIRLKKEFVASVLNEEARIVESKEGL